MKLTIDVENDVLKRGGKIHMDPFEADNKLVMVGILTDKGNEYLFRTDTDEQTVWVEKIQSLLDSATMLIGHNIVHDLMWLWESNFTYDGEIFDTMLGEYILQRGQKQPLSLEACAERYNLETKKQSTMKEYFKNGTLMSEVPPKELAEYLSADLHATQELYNEIHKKLQEKNNNGIYNTVLLTNKVALTLANIYRHGFSVDMDSLQEVKQQFVQEKNEVSKKLSRYVKELMGDTPINLNSPEQMSWVVYSRKPIQKELWANSFTPYMSKTDFNKTVKEKSSILFKTKAIKCNSCNGKGHIRKTKKNGLPYANQSKCHDCSTLGYKFLNTDKVAGLKFNAPSAKWVSANGFKVNKVNLSLLQNIAKNKNMTEAVEFLSNLQRLSALDTYLSSFVEGIETHTKADGKLHVRLLQHRTATGRFSGADPNMQNMPRGGTFPVKKVFVSRWVDGKILEADFAQLEFRTAAYLSQDEVAMKEIENGFDVHSYTAKVITEGGQKISRQEAKAHTFAPLYGATGFGRTKAEATYYEQFTEKYRGIGLWHTRLAKEAINDRLIKTPSGREFSFPNVRRLGNGKVSYFTQIKNFPVQSFATADIVPVILMEIDDRLNDLKSCIVNTVHDSIVIDVHPNEIQQVIDVISSVNDNMTDIINKQFNIKINVPLLLEAKIGNNWLDTKDIM
jgi:DNA polymerase I-like protein with 3'-5' exonuclease and polymerase domains